MSEKQKTIKKPVSLKGKGLHTGAEVELTFRPAPENSWYKFQRVDLPGKPIISAIAENVVDTSRGTTIEENGARVCTVEHVLAAAYGLEIDNLLIEINGMEPPIIDGSSRYFVESLASAGIVEQEAEKKYYCVKNNIAYFDEDNEIEIVAFPDDKFSVNLVIDYKSKTLISQYAELAKLSDFKNEIATCRTFVFLHELEALLKNNLIKGGDLDNAIVIIDREVTQEELDRLADLFKKPHVQVKGQGFLNNTELFFPNECARHKLLDLLGDLALLGQPLKGRIIAKRTGHFSNVEFAKKIRKHIKKERSKNDAPAYNPNNPPLMDINQIKRILPHRYPFLLVDKILEMDDSSVIGLKNVTYNEAFFVGHFPDEPVMPGVLQIEAFAQVGGIMVLSSVPDPENYSTYFLKIENVKFKRKVVPGDTLIFKLELVSPIRRGIANMRGQAFVGDSVAMEGEMMAQIIKKQVK